MAALAGLTINAIWGFNPVAILSGFSLLMLFLPVLGLGFEHNPEVVQTIANGIVERIVNAMPSLIVGQAAGMMASAIFKAFKGFF
jgi:hypothetical protein